MLAKSGGAMSRRSSDDSGVIADALVVLQHGLHRLDERAFASAHHAEAQDVQLGVLLWSLKLGQFLGKDSTQHVGCPGGEPLLPSSTQK